ncbi:MAG: hypothetical protein AB7G93_22675 [Bdellovibrionales bacterium]
MKFENYIDQVWTDHANHPQKVADGFGDAASLVETSEHLTQLTAIVTHVMGEHLGKWTEGQVLLESLQEHKAFIAGTEADMAIRRSIAVMKLGRNELQNLLTFGRSDQVRILAVTSSALGEREPDRGKELLLKALDLARQGLEKEDPANRALAVSGNNLACALEEKESRAPAENELLILAAKTGREFWEIAGGWLEVSRAEYRLGMSYLATGNMTKALQHAQTCVEMCRENKAGDLDMFFALEVLAKVEKARQNHLGFNAALDQATRHFEKLSPEDREWCEPYLKKIRV